MPKVITTHKVNGCNDGIDVVAVDDPVNGAHAMYEIRHINSFEPARSWTKRLAFQNGPIKEAGVNGVTHEVLLAVVIDRLEGYQSGQFACEENAVALEALRTAVIALKSRTQKRLARGVEGTHQV